MYHGPNLHNMNSYRFNVHNQSYQFPPNPHPVQHGMQGSPFNRYRPPLRPNQPNHEEHWCETCDRGFYAFDLLEKHKQQHQKCNIDGCQFIAHPKVITKHIQMQHASGLYKKIPKLNNPEEIQKWRDERKKKYPTKENIEKKAAEIKEKIDRGEKMGLYKDKRHFNRGTPNKNYASRHENHGQNRHRQPLRPGNTPTLNKIRKPVVPRKVHNLLPSAESVRKMKPFAGIQDIVMEIDAEDIVEDAKSDFVIVDEDSEDLMKQVKTNDDEPKVCGALSSLMCDYDFTDDEVDDNENALGMVNKVKEQSVTIIKTNEVKKQSLNNISLKENVIKDNNHIAEKSDDDDGPEEMKIEKSEQQTFPGSKKNEENKIKKKTFVDKRPKFSAPKRKIPSTLLQKLLKREVQQERNIVLQCVRYIVKNNYFDKNK